jgi:hypothetical protein
MSRDYVVQERINSMLRRGVVFSIIWLLGVGSLLAVVIGIRALRIIVRSDGEIEGTGKALWCVIVGGLGLLFWVFVIAMGIVNQSR